MQIAVNKLSVAPMMDWTDRHCRFFHRQLARGIRLYTEMLPAPGLVRGAERLLAFSEQEHPVAVQIGGGAVEELAAAAAMAARRGYDEINLNVGCPSSRVRKGAFGACLMRDPVLVRDAVSAMMAAADVPVSVKCRLALDGHDDYAFLTDFVGTVAESGCARFIVHARIAVLGGLTPAQNREIPPLDYPRVHRLKADFPHLEIVVNGGIRNACDLGAHLDHVDGAMIGRAVYQDPLLLARLAGEPQLSPFAAIERMQPYIESHCRAGGRLHDVTRHMMGLANGMPGARRYRRLLAEGAREPGAGFATLAAAAGFVGARAA